MNLDSNIARAVTLGDIRLAVVIPCYNEREVLPETHRRLLAVLEKISLPFEMVYVDDGSRDNTLEILRRFRATDDRIRVVGLSRNFGHQMAISAGLRYANGDAVVIVDADLQDPPEMIPDMVELWRQGWDVVYGLRTDREGETPFKRMTANLFYRVMNAMSNVPIPLDTGDFRLVDRKVVAAVLAMPERDRFLRGMITWAGFRQVALPYRRAPRFAGETKYPLVRMLRFALDGIFSFSTAPLKLASLFGFGCSLLALLGGGIVLWFRLETKQWVAGWASLFLAVLFLGGVQLLCLGIVGEYVGRIYGECKGRPLYFVREHLGAEVDTRTDDAGFPHAVGRE
jgi:glycosyltransferase involved in cell wall biosynthesis